jgi:hypothetical protein
VIVGGVGGDIRMSAGELLVVLVLLNVPPLLLLLLLLFVLVVLVVLVVMAGMILSDGIMIEPTSYISA